MKAVFFLAAVSWAEVLLATRFTDQSYLLTHWEAVAGHSKFSLSAGSTREINKMQSDTALFAEAESTRK